MFQSMAKIPIKWKASLRRPIPSQWREFSSRSSSLHQAGNRNASHPVNALLNYAYAVLQSHVHMRTVASGYDPFLGLMHSDQEYAPAFVFDLMEVERPRYGRLRDIPPMLVAFGAEQTSNDNVRPRM